MKDCSYTTPETSSPDRKQAETRGVKKGFVQSEHNRLTACAGFPNFQQSTVKRMKEPSPHRLSLIQTTGESG